jgi:hypothetical protein
MKWETQGIATTAVVGCVLLIVPGCLAAAPVPAHLTKHFANRFFTTNVPNETITMCAFDDARGVVLGRTHWLNTPFNNDSCALQGVVWKGRDGTYTRLQGVGGTLSEAHGSGPFRFEVALQGGEIAGQWMRLASGGSGSWKWTYRRSATEVECAAVLAAGANRTT